jgi:regulator of replication initiation timing
MGDPYYENRIAALEADNGDLLSENADLQTENAKLQAVLKDIAYSGMHMTVGEIRERALGAIKEVDDEY